MSDPKVQDDKLVDGKAPGPIEMMAGDTILPMPDDLAAEKSGWQPDGEEKKVWSQFRRRKQALLNSRYNVYGFNIDAQMRRWDRLYFRRQADIPASELDPNQRPLAINHAYGKIQTALGILIDSNPEYILEEDNPRYSANRAFLKALAEKSFRNTNSLGQFKLSVFNSAKRGWFIGRTFNRRLFNDARFLKSIDNKGKKHYMTRTVTKVDDVAYMNLSNYNAWVDEQTMPEDFFSTRDWMWRELWYIDDLKRTFPKVDFPNMKYVKAGGDTRENIQGVFTRNAVSNKTGTSPIASKRGMTEVFFYENQYSDQFIIEANGVMIVWEPLPQNNKRLSCVYGPWHLRGDDTIYGLGIIEEMENDEELVDRILNMDMRQLLLTISPMGFFSGTEDMEDENIRITPGIMRRTLNPQNVTWLQVPQGNTAGLEKIQWLEQKQDEKTGINDTIDGSSGDSQPNMTAFQAGIEREAGLKRLRLPLKSLQYALQWEFNNRVSLIQQVYSDFTVEHLEGKDEIFKYLDEIKADPQYFQIENEGEVGKEKFWALRYRTASLNVEKTDDGKFIESETQKFFPIKPEYLEFTGFISVDESSLLTTSEALDQANTLRMVNMLVPLLQGQMQVNAKIAKQLCISFNKDQKDWLPDDWVKYLATGQMPQANGPVSPATAALNATAANQPPNNSAPPTNVVPPTQLQNGPDESAINGKAFTT